MGESMSESISLNVTGMKCGGCENNVKGKLESLEGIIAVAASSKENSISIEYNSSQASLDDIKNTIAAAGFVVVE